nr:G-type lectin S-receptor-like serine/threonine-protein kinase At1g11410 [Ipomoea batatas]
MLTTKILLPVILLSFLVCFCCSTDTITFNQILKDGDLLISKTESFALGFFSPENSPGSKYVGIWYQQIPGKTVVWVANRDRPVTGESGILFIDDSGNLVIQDTSTNISVSVTNQTSPATGTKGFSARLLDTGNLVLYHNQDSKWQSFDYPTNTLLPSMKLGEDKKTGLNRILQSWKSSNDPSMGHYTENEDEVTITYSLRDPSVPSMFVLNESGTVNWLTWQGNKGWVSSWSAPQDQCDSYGRCDVFSNCNSSGGFECSCLTGFQPLSNQEWKGCGRNNKTDVCRNGEGFLRMTGVKIPDTQTAVVNRTVGITECQNLCLNNCSCNGYASANVSEGGMGCFVWYGELKDMREVTNGGQDMFLRVSASDLAQLKRKSKRHISKMVEIILVVAVAAVVALLVCCLIITMRKRKRKQKNTRDLNTCSQSYEGSSMGLLVDETGSTDVSIFDLKTIQFATDNFSADNKLGQGGFGSVYKETIFSSSLGKLPNEQLVAVKRLSRTSGQGIEEFKNEVTLIARLQHRNLVRLLGCCVEQGEKMLVWDFWSEGMALNIVDPSLGESYDGRKVSRCIHVWLLCVQASANVRPTMSEVVFMLCNETKLPRPNQPGFILLRQQDHSAGPSSSINGRSQSVNSMTMTEIDGR